MPVDGIGGGDSGLEARQKRIEEERARELDRVERRHKEEVAKTQELREKELQRIYDAQSSEVEEKQAAAEARIAQVRDATEARIRNFEAESNNMAEEAKRQFQAKADLLNRSARELDEQRRHMIQAHEQSTKRLKESRELADADMAAKVKRESQKAYFETQNRARSLEEQGAAEIERIRQDQQGLKQKELAESERELATLKATRDDQKESVNREIEFWHKQSEKQLESAQAKQAAREAYQEQAFENRMRELTHQNQAATNQANKLARDRLNQTKEVYDNEIDSLTKSAKRTTSEIKNRNFTEQATLERDGKNQRELLERTNRLKQAEAQAKTEEMQAESKKKLEALKAKQDAEFKSYSSSLVKKHQQAISAQTAQDQRELLAAGERGKKQINEMVAKKKQEVANHAAKIDDPFYQVESLEAEIDDNERECVIRVRVPPHEEDSIRISRQPTGLTLSGTRSFKDGFVDEQGHKIASASYQSYSESFPVSGKLEMGKMRRQYADGTLTFWIPKS